MYGPQTARCHEQKQVDSVRLNVLAILLHMTINICVCGGAAFVNTLPETQQGPSSNDVDVNSHIHEPLYVLPSIYFRNSPDKHQRHSSHAKLHDLECNELHIQSSVDVPAQAHDMVRTVCTVDCTRGYVSQCKQASCLTRLTYSTQCHSDCIA